MHNKELLAFFAANGCFPRDRECTPRSASCVDMVSAQTAMLARAANRTSYYNLAISALASGATIPNTAANPPFVDTLQSNSMWRCIYVTDLVTGGLAAGTSADDLRIDIVVSGVIRQSFLAGRFSRSNSNDCVSACGIKVCAGPMETVVINVTNQAAVALAAGAVGTVETRVVYSGEKGFCCADEGSCVPDCDPAEGAVL